MYLHKYDNQDDALDASVLGDAEIVTATRRRDDVGGRNKNYYCEKMLMRWCESKLLLLLERRASVGDDNERDGGDVGYTTKIKYDFARGDSSSSNRFLPRKTETREAVVSVRPCLGASRPFFHAMPST